MAAQVNPPETSSIPASPVVPPSKEDPSTTPVSSKTPESSAVITIPSYSRWFSWDSIHESERRFLPEFFDGKSPWKNSYVYKYLRDTIIRKFRDNPSRKITFTEVRKALVGDVGSIRRVFDFLEGWGLINYTTPTSKLLPQSSKGGGSGEDSKGSNNNNKSSGDFAAAAAAAGSPYEPAAVSKKETASNKLCSGCETLCQIACFYCDKFDITVCARCYVRSNYKVGATSSDFRRVEISDETKAGWTEKETLQLLEAIMHYGDDWKKVAEHVSGRTEIECVARFIKLPFGEQFVGPPDSEVVDGLPEEQSDAEIREENNSSSSPAKRRCLTPLADASNPIMAQAAFLSAMVGKDVAEASAQAAVAAFSEDLANNHARNKESIMSLPDGLEKIVTRDIANGDATSGTLEEMVIEAQSLIEKEEQDLNRSISGIIEVQMKEIHDKIVRFEEFELQMEKERKQLKLMENLLFVDRLALRFHRPNALANGQNIEKGGVKTTNAVTGQGPAQRATIHVIN